MLSSPYVYDCVFVLVVRRPYRDFVSFRSNVDDGAAHVIAVIVKSFAHQTQELKQTHFSCYTFIKTWSISEPESEDTHRLEPEAIQICSALLFGQSDEPASTTFIPLILPHGLDSVLLGGEKKNK